MYTPFILAFFVAAAAGQRITTIQLDGVQYFISRMNPYSPELNYFLAYQYCRSIGLQLASFETKEKSDSIMEYLKNAGYHKYDFWTSGNRLGADMMIWMSTGLPFNATFDYMRKAPGEDVPVARQLGAVEQRKDSGAADGCVALRAPDLIWDTDDCTSIKDFICEQTRCYYYNYGSIPVSSSQGNKIRTPATTAAAPTITTTVSTITAAPTTTTMTMPKTTTAAAATSISTTIPVTKAPPTPECGSNNSTDTTATTQMIDCVTENESNYTTVEAQTTNPPAMLRTVARNKPAEKTDSNTQENASPWSWARNIMLEKPVLKKSSSL